VDEPVYKVVTVDIAAPPKPESARTTPSAVDNDLTYESVEVEDHSRDENQIENSDYAYVEDEDYFYEYPEDVHQTTEGEEEDIYSHPELMHEDLYRNFGSSHNEEAEEDTSGNDVYPKDSPYRSEATSVSPVAFLVLLLSSSKAFLALTRAREG